MITAFLQLNLNEKYVSWAVHSYLGEVTDKPVTASAGLIYTNVNYMTRKELATLQENQNRVVTEQAKPQDPESPATKLANEALDVQTQDLGKLFCSELIERFDLQVKEFNDIPALTAVNVLAVHEYMDRSPRDSFTGYKTFIDELLVFLRGKYEVGEECPVHLVVTNKRLIIKGAINTTFMYSGSVFKVGIARANTILNLARVQENYSNVLSSDFKKLWQPITVRNPLMSQRFLIHDSVQESRFYRAFDDRVGKDIYDFGKRTSSVAYSLIAPKNRDDTLDKIVRSELREKLEPTTHYINLANFYKPVVNNNVGMYGTDILYKKAHETMYNDDLAIGGYYPTPGLTQRGHEHHIELEKVLIQYMEKTSSPDFDLTDITEYLYEDLVKGTRKLKAIVGKEKLLRVPSPGRNKLHTFLSLGVCLPDRNSLNRLTGDIKVFIYAHKTNNLIRYGIIISSNEGDAIYSNYNTNVRLVMLKNTEKDDGVRS